MTSLPTVRPEQLSREEENNTTVVLKQLFPELDPLLVGDIAKIVAYCHETKVNPDILPGVIRGIYNLSVGTGNGQVIVYVTRQVVNIQVREQGEELKTQV